MQRIGFEFDGPRRCYVLSTPEPEEHEELQLRAFVEEKLLPEYSKKNEDGGSGGAVVPLARFETELVGFHSSYLGDEDRFVAYIGPLSQDEKQLVEEVLGELYRKGDIVVSK